MEAIVRKRWINLCTDAAMCEDPDRLEELSKAIVQMLGEEKKRLEQEGRGRRSRNDL